MATKTVKNLILDPRMVWSTDTTAWTVWTGTPGQATKSFLTGQTAFTDGITTAQRVTFTANQADGEGGGLAAYDMPIEAGKPLLARAQFRVSRTQRVMIWIDIKTADGLTFGPPRIETAIAPANSPITIELNGGPVEDGYALADMYIMGNYPDTFGGPGHVAYQIGDWIDGTGALLTQDVAVYEPVPAFFDGSSVDTVGVTYDWTGTPNHSPSTRLTVINTLTSSSRAPFLVHVYDKDFDRKGWAQDFSDLSLTPMHNGVGTANFTLPADHPRVGDLMAPGARAIVTYGGTTVDDIVVGGPVRTVKGSGPASRATVTFGIEDDYRVMNQILGWPNPGESIFNQGYDDDGEYLGDYHRIQGPAETVVKGFVAANNPRLGLPITLAPDLARGADIDVRMRMHPLTERLMPAVDQAGLGVRVRQTSLGPDGGGLTLDVYEPVVRQRALTESSGTLLEWSWSQGGPNNTRVIVGGQGEGVDRDFTMKTDTAREAEWGTASIHEVFRDARDVELGNYDLLEKRADETLAEGAPTAGLKLTLAETDTFRYGRTVLVGDKVTVRVAPGVEITDVLRSVQLNYSVSNGLEIEPVVGDSTAVDEHDMLIARAIRRLAEGIRDIKARS